MQKNFWHLYQDILWFGVLSGSAVAFLSIYAVRLGAGGFQIGLLTAGPAVINLVISLPAARWLEQRSLIRVSFLSAALQRFGYLPLVLLPWFFASNGQVIAIILVTLFMAIPGTMLAIGFNAMFAEVVPSRWRAEVMGKRNALLAVSTTLATLLSGVILDNIVFPRNYQIVFGLGLVGAALSTYHLSRLQPAPEALRLGLPANGAAHPSLAQFRQALRKLEKLPLHGGAALRSLARFDLLRGRLGVFMAAYLIFYTFQYLCIPIFPLAFVNVLHLSDGMISLGNAIFYAAMFLSSMRLQRLAVRHGHHRLLVGSAVALGAYPLLIGLARGPFLYLAGSLMGGLVWGVLSASLLNRLMEVVPDDQRAIGMAFHNLAFNLGILAGSLGGPALSASIGVDQSLLVGAGMRMLAGLLLFYWA